MDTSESLPSVNADNLNVVKDGYNYESSSIIENNQSFNPKISAAQLDNFYSQMNSDLQSSNSNEIISHSGVSVATQESINNVVDQDNVQNAAAVPSRDMTMLDGEHCDQFHQTDSSDMNITIAAKIVDNLSMEVSKKKKVCDVLRVQKVLEELSARSAPAEHVHAARYKKQKIANDARMLLLEYAKELSSAILEESCLLAKHRKSKELLIPDLKLIFGT